LFARWGGGEGWGLPSPWGGKKPVPRWERRTRGREKKLVEKILKKGEATPFKAEP